MATHAEASEPRGRGQARIASGLTLVLGLWLIVSPLLLEVAGGAAWNNIVFGFAIVLLAAGRVVQPVAKSRLASWINAVIGVWLVASPVAFDFVTRAATWNNAIVGVLVVAFALWSSTQPRRAGSSSGHSATSRGASS